MNKRIKPGRCMAVGFFFACAIACNTQQRPFAKSTNFYFALVPLLLANMCASASQTVNNPCIQLLVDDSVTGRMSSLMLLSYGLTPLGVFPMAIAADRIGAASAIAGACALLVLLTWAFFVLSSTLRNLDQNVNAVIAAGAKQGAGKATNLVDA